MLLALERELVPRARREDKAEGASHRALLLVGGAAVAGESGRTDSVCRVNGQDS